MDMNSNYGEENIDIKNLHNFKSHLSELKFIFYMEVIVFIN